MFQRDFGFVEPREPRGEIRHDLFAAPKGCCQYANQEWLRSHLLAFAVFPFLPRFKARQKLYCAGVSTSAFQVSPGCTN